MCVIPFSVPIEVEEAGKICIVYLFRLAYVLGNKFKKIRINEKVHFH